MAERLKRGTTQIVAPRPERRARLSLRALRLLVLELRHLLARLRQPPEQPGVRGRETPRDLRGLLEVRDRLGERVPFRGAHRYQLAAGQFQMGVSERLIERRDVEALAAGDLALAHLAQREGPVQVCERLLGLGRREAEVDHPERGERRMVVRVGFDRAGPETQVGVGRAVVRRRLAAPDAR
ncbi:MAG: hypothetical protein DMG07_16510, partial [Acidobacteria bacterium]